MTDYTPSLAARSDQLNAVDLVAGPITVKIRRAIYTHGAEQPLVLDVGIEGKPYKPGLTCRRILAKLLGGDTENLVGHSLTLYCDMDVKYPKTGEVGGIRISDMTGIPARQEIKAKASQRKVVTYIINPLVISDATMPAYSDESIDKNEAAWRSLFSAGTDPEKVIGNIKIKCTLTAAQETRIRNMAVAKTKEQLDDEFYGPGE